tara:strand:+ start:415 stop:738 length:324 start_codon:yes stop_codon:yes gene_type:complete
MSANNVVSFPTSYSPEVPKDLGEDMDANKMAFVDEVMGHYMVQLANQLGTSGFHIAADEFIYDYSVTVEMLRATLYRSVGLKHALQDDLDELTVKVIQARLDQEKDT